MLHTGVMHPETPQGSSGTPIATLILPSFITGTGTIDTNKLQSAVKVAVRDMDRLLNVSHFPSESTRRTVLFTRSIGIGVQGLADVLRSIGVPYGSSRARQINCGIFEAVYIAAVESSAELAAHDGRCVAWTGSPAEQRRLQVDLWGASFREADPGSIRESVARHGLRNLALTAQTFNDPTSRLWNCSDSVVPVTRSVPLLRPGRRTNPIPV